jgi:hypothetical protein
MPKLREPVIQKPRKRLELRGFGVRVANASGTLTGMLIPLLAQRAGIGGKSAHSTVVKHPASIKATNALRFGL